MINQWCIIQSACLCSLVFVRFSLSAPHILRQAQDRLFSWAMAPTMESSSPMPKGTKGKRAFRAKIGSSAESSRKVRHWLPNRNQLATAPERSQRLKQTAHSSHTVRECYQHPRNSNKNNIDNNVQS